MSDESAEEREKAEKAGLGRRGGTAWGLSRKTLTF